MDEEVSTGLGESENFCGLVEEDWDVMFFKVCREDLGGSEAGRKQNVFHPGCTNFKKCNVRKHQEIENHQHTMERKKTGEAEPGTSDTGKMTTKMNERTNSA